MKFYLVNVGGNAMKDFYTVKEIAALLNCSIAVVYSYERNGYIKRIKSADRNYGVGQFSKTDVNRLLAAKEELDSAGKSFSDLAKELDVHPGTIKEAVTSLNLKVNKVPIVLYATRERYALSPEQEHQIKEYLNQDQTIRPRRNYLYYTHIGLARFQLFLLDRKQKVRLTEGENGRIGFYLGNQKFLPYVEAEQKFNLTSAYPIHKPEQEKKGNSSFTDLIISTQAADFYEILDKLYSICGIENFNARIQNEKLFVSVINGDYIFETTELLDVADLLNQYVVFGKVTASENRLIFSRPQKVIEIQLDNDVYENLSKEAQIANTSLTGWIQTLLKERDHMLKKDI